MHVMNYYDLSAMPLVRASYWLVDEGKYQEMASFQLFSASLMLVR